MTGALRELVIARTREFLREPEAVFWTYCFPVLLMAGLGVAFRGGGAQESRVALIEGPRADEAQKALSTRGGFKVELLSAEQARAHLAQTKVDLIVDPRADGVTYSFDPTRPEGASARRAVNDALQEAWGRKDPVTSSEVTVTEPGSRYIDWLIPGILGMNIMGGGMWGLGFVTVDLRMRKVLKRFVATPMRHSDFFLALIASRMLFLITEVAAILLVGRFVFGLEIRGSLASLALISIVGASAFAGIGLLTASRTDKIEVASGLMNVIMLPMWLVSGIFFSPERFPEAMQPLVQALPLTQLNNALRAVILQGAPLASQWLPVLVLAAYSALAFMAALKWFRWN